jgi:hypothetical protein
MVVVLLLQHHNTAPLTKAEHGLLILHLPHCRLSQLMLLLRKAVLPMADIGSL